MIISTDDVSKQIVVVAFQATRLTAQALYRAIARSAEKMKQEFLTDKSNLYSTKKKNDWETDGWSAGCSG